MAAPDTTPIPPSADVLQVTIEKLEYEAGKMRRTIKRQDKLLEAQTKTISEAEWKLILSRAFGALMFKAFNALSSYGVNYRKLRTFKNWEGIDYFTGSDQQKYREAITKLIVETEHDIDAAIRRKGLKEVDLNK